MDILYRFSATITNASIKLAKNQTCKTMKKTSVVADCLENRQAISLREGNGLIIFHILQKMANLSKMKIYLKYV